ncbi:MAG: hypothetical protein EP336_03055 [Rhodobacteraceae bacterium]|nr:MAG: hypothetical protein EP336_03055 [Paracoccaceae bacterium]
MLTRALFFSCFASLLLLNALPMAAQTAVSPQPDAPSPDLTPDMTYKSRKAMILDISQRLKQGDYAGLIRRLDSQHSYSDAQISELSTTLTTLYGNSLDQSDTLYHARLSDTWQEDIFAFWQDGTVNYLYLHILSHDRAEGVLAVLWSYNSSLTQMKPAF